MKDDDCNRGWNLATKIFLGLWGAGVISINPCLAQSNIIPDNTLGTEASQVTTNVNNSNGIPSELIEGGAQRGQNLFHSFQEFNVNEGRGAYFLVPNETIQNVLTRVTGTNRSQILGTLGTASNRNFAPTNANLFLINPNGIVFGRTASLDVNGSFVGTTANAVEFGERGFFSATNPQAPSGLLTVAPSALLFNQINAQVSIQNDSVAPSGLNPSSAFTARGLRVPDGKSLLLVGGDISMDGGGLYAFGGRVELGGLAGAGTVGLNEDGNNLSLSFPDGVERSDVSLSNGARVNVRAGDSGSIAVNARNFEMTGESELRAGIATGLGDARSQAGNIEINATGAINLNNGSFITNLVESEATGQGGDVNISASSLRLESGARASAITSGAGKAGNITVNASDVQLIGISADDQLASGFFAAAQPNSSGDAGDLTINTQTLLVRDGAQAGTGTFGKGKGGNLTVDAQDVQLIGSSAITQSGLFTNADLGATGNGGNIKINSRELLVRDRALIFAGARAGTTSLSNGGSVVINTQKLFLQDGGQIGAGTRGMGRGGDVMLQTDTLQLIGTDAGLPSFLFSDASPNSTGDAGDLKITTRQLLVKDGAQVSVSTSGAGKGGNLTVDAQDVQVIGRSTNGQRTSILGASAQPNSTGDAGNLTIKTNTLLVRDGAQISAATFGAGKGGNLSVNASDVQLIGRSTNGRTSSGLFASAQQNSIGDAGDLTITTSQLQVLDGAIVSASTFGEGKGGSLTVNTDTLQLSNDGTISALSDGTGVAGNITLNIENDFTADNGQVLTQAEQSSGGDITITTGENIFLRNDSDIRTTLSTTAGSGGNITLNANAIVALEDSDILAFAPEGTGGNITFNTPAFFSDPVFRTTSQTTDRATLDALAVNNRVDVNASGRISGGTISGIPDISFLQNSLIELPENLIDTEALVASSCVVRSNKRNGTFTITGKAGLPYRPGDAVASIYSAVDVQPVPDNTSATKPAQRWKIGDPIVEPAGVYRLENGQSILSRECGK